MKQLIFLLMLLIPSFSFAEQVTLQWDCGQCENVTKFNIYMKKKVQTEYDFTNPIATIQTPTMEATINAPTIFDRVQGYNFVARSANDTEESENSNEVTYYVVGKVPVSPDNLTASYNDGIITINFEQPSDPYEIDHWKVFYVIDGVPEYTELYSIHNLNDLPVSIGSPAGGTIYLTAVSYRKDEAIYSAYSNVVILTTNGPQAPSTPEGLMININHPVR